MRHCNGRLCKISLFIVVIFLWSGIFFFDGNKQTKKNLKWYMKEAPCSLPEKNLTEMVELTFMIHNVLDKLDVAHVLCFGTLWGALRRGALLPWDNNVDICVTSSQVNKASSSDIIPVLRDSGAKVTYNSQYGFYEIKYQNVVGYINILTENFSLGESMMSQIGWGRWILFRKETEFSIPSRFMESPFPTVKFYDHEMPVPHEDIEMLKYLYPNNWWIEVKPLGCK